MNIAIMSDKDGDLKVYNDTFETREEAEKYFSDNKLDKDKYFIIDLDKFCPIDK